MRVLILTDEEATRAAVVGLTPPDFPPPQAALTVDEALAVAATCPPDMVLVDLDRHGPEGAAALRAAEALKEVPLLALTSADGLQAYEAAAAADAFDFVTRPIQPEAYLGRLRAVRALRRQQEECRQQTRELERVNAELRRLTGVDELTGLANRRSFNQAVAQEWSRAARDGTPLSLLMVDIDHFKDYNDHFGHPRGDECLRRVAGALTGAVHRSGDSVARYGGEDFTVLLPRTGLPGAVAVAESLRSRVEALDLEHPRSSAGGKVTISVGVASTVPSRTDSFDVLVDAADRATYEAKRAGRNRTRASVTPLPVQLA
jgi:two-component system chemotaxis family response regulator WspR